MTAPPPSLWLATLPESLAGLEPAAPLSRDVTADVAIVGAGYTGLWTAWYLAQARPDLSIVVLEKEFAGFGASGRNGGWASALLPMSLASVAHDHGPEAALAQDAAMRASVDEVVARGRELGVGHLIAKGGTVTLARTPVQLERARADVAGEHALGLGEEQVRLLDADQARARLAATDVLGGTYTPDCAAIHPAALARALARGVQDAGVTLYEGTEVTALEPHRVTTPGGTVTADVVVRATEGYTAGLPGYERAVAPVYSLMIATEPLSDQVWERIGLAERETFSDYRHLIIYGQRTADGRMVFGGRGAPYHFGSATHPRFDSDATVFRLLQDTLVELFPSLADARITHRWGGALGIARDWEASVGLDSDTGLAWAGGYVGDGVTTTNLAGRTLRDLILGQDTELTALPWVGHRSHAWEPEPLRWLGVNAGLTTMRLADGEERLTRRSSLLARAMAPLTGGH
ncbi:FAD-binding oxidoreductase [Demequina sp. NBRC 110056]|uniref:NAD(P)/FAD-dependent oxidoreductase n=1 Tax=Demequina sp. NBRC 110056 TaxID=1570345 RepID=UPI00190EAEFB|nr:FAD-binding oxidoreductase [Demequina sp. NBRC 110056]